MYWDCRDGLQMSPRLADLASKTHNSASAIFPTCRHGVLFRPDVFLPGEEWPRSPARVDASRDGPCSWNRNLTPTPSLALVSNGLEPPLQSEKAFGVVWTRVFLNTLVEFGFIITILMNMVTSGVFILIFSRLAGGIPNRFLRRPRLD